MQVCAQTHTHTHTHTPKLTDHTQLLPSVGHYFISCSCTYISAQLLFTNGTLVRVDSIPELPFPLQQNHRGVRPNCNQTTPDTTPKVCILTSEGTLLQQHFLRYVLNNLPVFVTFYRFFLQQSAEDARKRHSEKTVNCGPPVCNIYTCKKIMYTG